MACGCSEPLLMSVIINGDAQEWDNTNVHELINGAESRLSLLLRPYCSSSAEALLKNSFRAFKASPCDCRMLATRFLVGRFTTKTHKRDNLCTSIKMHRRAENCFSHDTLTELCSSNALVKGKCTFYTSCARQTDKSSWRWLDWIKKKF
jgi:hypothetical protein